MLIVFLGLKLLKLLGKGGQRLAVPSLGWNRVTVRKFITELESGLTCLLNFSARVCSKVEDHLPNLLSDIKEIVDSQSQTDPSFKTKRLYRRISAEEIRQQLIYRQDYDEQELPCQETIRRKQGRTGLLSQKS